MDEERREGWRDVLALLTLGCIGGGGATGAVLLLFHAFPQLLGTSGVPMDNRLIVPLLVMAALVAGLGYAVGGIAWIVVMSRILPKHTMHRWVTYGPQIKPLLSVNLKLLDRAYRGRL